MSTLGRNHLSSDMPLQAEGPLNEKSFNYRNDMTDKSVKFMGRIFVVQYIFLLGGPLTKAVVTG